MLFKIPVTEEILNLVAHLDHFRGVWSQDSRVALERTAEIRQEVKLRSTIAASSLVGIHVSESEIRALLAEQATSSGDQAEVVGYAKALDHVLPSWDQLLSTDEIRRLHCLIMGSIDGDSSLSPWRAETYELEAFDDEGSALGVIFPTLPPRLIPETMENLVTWLELELRSRQHHPLLVIGAFILALLTACPFMRGNWRLSTVLTVLMLDRAGYGFIRFASLERILEERRKIFFNVLSRCQTHLWSGGADLDLWLSFFLAGLKIHTERVALLLKAERKATEFSPLQRSIIETVRRHGTAEAGLLIRTTGANRNTLKDNLRRLVDRGVLEKLGRRRGTRYRIKL